MEQQSLELAGTIVWVAPFYNRSGYGFGSRAAVCALHRAGLRIRVIPVNEVEAGIDDCDLSLIKSLESTPLIAPITIIVNHVPARAWLDIKLPEPNLRILATTFDGSLQGALPPAEWINICKEMDQVWLMVEKERQAFVSAGLSAEKTQLVYWPHPWIANPSVEPPGPEAPPGEKPFRFLSIAMFQPRRRWDTLIEAFFEEFRSEENVELYFKVNYPFWHPVPGKPGEDLHELVATLRRKTGSQAPVVIDEELGTRAGIVRLMDSCNVYVSTDTAATAPISEARARRRMVIAPEGVGSVLGLEPDHYFGIAEDPDAKFILTEQMLQYQPHHKGAFMPRLHVGDVRDAMRRAFEMSGEERYARTEANRVPGPIVTNPLIVGAIKAGWRSKELREKTEAKKGARRIIWEGPQLVAHCSGLVNRELSLQLIDCGCELSILACENDRIPPDSDPRFQKLVDRMGKPLSSPAEVHVRNNRPPDFTPPPEGRWVMMESWEYGRLPEEWIEPMVGMVDEFWVPSSHVLKAFIVSGIPRERVKLVPNGVDSSRFYPVVRDKGGGQKFRFLFVGGRLWQKGADVLLNSYRKAFRRTDPVVLIVKDSPQREIYREERAVSAIMKEMQRDPDAPEVIHYTQMLEPAKMAGLYNACDCLVHPYRAEGSGLAVVEAMACGLPVIVTEGGATDDFCPPEDTFRIPSKRFDFSPGPLRLAGGGAGWMLEPDGEALVAMLRQVFEKNTSAAKKALEVSVRIRADYDWARIGEKVKARLDSFAGKAPVRNTVTGKRLKAGPDPLESLCIRWEGAQFVNHSLALVNRELCLRLIDSGHELTIIPYEKDQFGPQADPRFAKIARRVHAKLSRSPDVHVRHLWPPNFTPPPDGHWVMIQPWEYGRLPVQWVAPMSALPDEIWVPSRHVLKSYVASGVPSDLVHVIPNGVHSELFRPGLKPYALASRKRFKFLFLGGTIWRKGIDVLLEAFRTTFSRNDDVSLIVKDMGTDSFYRGQGAEGMIRSIQNDPDAPEVVHLKEMLADEDMPRLLAACDCLAHPYRGEGFGLPVLEAMACGLPVITTEGGATDDFCPADRVFLIPSVRRDFCPQDMLLAGGAGWVLEPDLNGLKALMREVFENSARAKERALELSGHIRRTFDWGNVSEKVAERIRRLSQKPLRRNIAP
ncbi:MAG: glycosyltransferase [Syntrophobacteraceae bacterium]|nr:glycosyltransferase [Syntrophobacteraceae bacterium]